MKTERLIGVDIDGDLLKSVAHQVSPLIADHLSMLVFFYKKYPQLPLNSLFDPVATQLEFERKWVCRPYSYNFSFKRLGVVFFQR